MDEYKQELDIFVLRVLRCCKEQRLTAEEIRGIYLGLYPQSLVAKTLKLRPVSIYTIRAALATLIACDFVHKELTNFIVVSLKKETEIFWISNKGRSYLLRKK